VWPTATFPRKPGSYQWMNEAACQGQAELFFRDADAARQEAIDVCLLDCPVYDQCLAYTKRARPDHGVFAGTTPGQRHRWRA